MRDAVGGAFMIKLLLVFLAIYTIFIAIAINYAKAFRVKNKVLDIIEQNEGIKNYSNVNDPVIVQVNDYMNNIHYGVNTATVKSKCEGYDYVDTKRGYCITKVDNGDASYYKVRSFVTISIPLVGLEYTIPISGETRKIEKVN